MTYFIVRIEYHCLANSFGEIVIFLYKLYIFVWIQHGFLAILD